MTIAQLKYVLSVAKNKSFTAASKECFVTQPTLSMQIKKLEESLGLEIFNRSHQRVKLTDIGIHIVDQIKIILTEVSRINDIISSEKNEVEGNFSIGIIPTLSSSIFPKFLKEFLKKFPKVNLTIKELTTEQIIFKLKNRELDCAIMATPLLDSELKEKPIFNEPFVVYSNEDFSDKKVKINDLENLILLKEGNCFRDNIIDFCADNINKINKFQIESNNFDSIISLVDEGFGMAILPYLYCDKIREKQKIFEFSEPIPSREISFVYHKSQLKIQIIDALSDIIKFNIDAIISDKKTKVTSPIKNKNIQI